MTFGFSIFTPSIIIYITLSRFEVEYIKSIVSPSDVVSYTALIKKSGLHLSSINLYPTLHSSHFFFSLL